jgi:hypothetical protein
MSAATPKAPVTNGAHAGLAIARVHDGRGMIGIIVMVMPTAVAATVGSPARIMAPANGSIAHAQDDRARDGSVVAPGWNGELARRRVGRRRLAFSAIPGGRS